MKQNRLLQKLWREETVFGLFCSLPQPHLVEMIGYVGFDFVIIDAEHTLVNLETLEQMVRAAEVSDLTALVRVPHASSPLILQALDAGADGIVVPHVYCAQEIQEAVRRARYAPEGMRSLNAGRSARFGIDDLPSFVREANKQVMVVPMIEDREGVEQIDNIVSVPGITMVLEGAADLSQSYGVAWQTSHSFVQQALRQIQGSASQHTIPFCAIPRSPEEIAYWSRQGVRAFVLGEQRGIVLRGLRDHLQLFRGYVEEAYAPNNTEKEGGCDS